MNYFEFLTNTEQLVLRKVDKSVTLQNHTTFDKRLRKTKNGRMESRGTKPAHNIQKNTIVGASFIYIMHTTNSVQLEGNEMDIQHYTTIYIKITNIKTGEYEASTYPHSISIRILSHHHKSSVKSSHFKDYKASMRFHKSQPIEIISMIVMCIILIALSQKLETILSSPCMIILICQA
jgi:hypothetical protein